MAISAKHITSIAGRKNPRWDEEERLQYVNKPVGLELISGTCAVCTAVSGSVEKGSHRRVLESSDEYLVTFFSRNVRDANPVGNSYYRTIGDTCNG